MSSSSRPAWLVPLGLALTVLLPTRGGGVHAQQPPSIRRVNVPYLPPGSEF